MSATFAHRMRRQALQTAYQQKQQLFHDSLNASVRAAAVVNELTALYIDSPNRAAAFAAERYGYCYNSEMAQNLKTYPSPQAFRRTIEVLSGLTGESAFMGDISKMSTRAFARQLAG